ncbi:MAG: hypothetical protein HXO56_07915 [Rothia dentocariosa]|uniref:Uncharacterized protein n=1 Tax=Rothia dentocariosa TaxID=2047 RepID=A0A930KKL0_9MICC|nr:hypothetical protein [Rothia dentocariosa]
MTGIIHLLENRETGKKLRVILNMSGECRIVAKDADSYFFGEEGHSRALKLLKPGATKTKYIIPKKMMMTGERVAKLSTISLADLASAARLVRDKGQKEEILKFCNVFAVFSIAITHLAKMRVWREDKMRWLSECSVCGLMYPTATHEQAVSAATRHVEKFHNLKLVRTAMI